MDPGTVEEISGEENPRCSITVPTVHDVAVNPE